MNAVTRTPTVIDQIERRIEGYAAVLPASIPAAKFVGAFKILALNSPDVMRADQRSVVIAVQQCAEDGLMPDGRDAAIVVRKGIAQYQRMVGGLIKLLYRSGQVSSVSVQVVHELDPFDFELGDNERIFHKPLLVGDRGERVAVYSVVTMKDGSKSRCLMGRDEVERIMRMSPQGWDRQTKQPKGIWAAHPSAMWSKTCLHKHVKLLPLEGMDLQPDASEPEDAAWHEPEDFTSQPDSGPGEAQDRLEHQPEPEEPFPGDTPPADGPTSRDADEAAIIELWMSRMREFREMVNGRVTVDGVEEEYNNWVEAYPDCPEDATAEIGKMISKRVAAIKQASAEAEAYTKAKG